MSAHTPEPWTIDTGGWPLVINGPENGQGDIIATIPCDIEEGGYPADVAEANAYLLLAAPKLLRACLRIEAVLAGDASDREVVEAYRAVRDAIGAARGEAVRP